MRTEEERIQKCPTCHSVVTEGQLGLRDFAWVGDSLPGKVGPSDLDCVIEQNRSGRVLIIEEKQAGKRLPFGQRLLLQRFVKLGCEVWCVWDWGDGTVSVGAMTEDGLFPAVERMPLLKLKGKVRAWWLAGLDSE